MISDQDVVELSCKNAYEYNEVGDELVVNGSTYTVMEMYNETNGYEYGLDAMLLQNSSGENVLIFTGSDKKNDFYNDWVVNNGSILIKSDVEQYKLGLDLVTEIENRGIVINKISGNSLGGGIATYIGVNRTDLSVVSVNPAPQVKVYDGEFSNIKVLIDNNDLLNYLTVASNRSQYVPGTRYMFTRGNSFFEVYLNHKGDSNEDNRAIYRQYPFDLMSNNIGDGIIDFSLPDVKELNENFTSRIRSYSDEFENNVFGTMKDILKDRVDRFKMESVYINVVNGVDSYLYSALPTLRSYIKFNYIFDKIKENSHLVCNSLFANLIEDLCEELKISKFKNRIYNDCDDVLTNFESIERIHYDNISELSNLVDNFNYADNGISSRKYVNPRNLYLKHGDMSINISYLKHFNIAKNFIYSSVRVGVVNKFRGLDSIIDGLIAPVRNIINVGGEIVGFVIPALKDEIDVAQAIISEIYAFNIGDFVANLLFSLCDEIIGIVLPKEIGVVINKLIYSSGIIGNICVTHDNYINYLSTLKGLSFYRMSAIHYNNRNTTEHYNKYLKNIYL